MSIAGNSNHIFTRNSTARRRNRALKYGGVLFVLAGIIGALMITPGLRAGAASSGTTAGEVDQNKRIVKDFDVNYLRSAGRLPSAAQLRSLEQFKTNLGDQKISSRWDKSNGSLDVIYDFTTPPSSQDPEATARAFIAANAGLFGIADINTLKLTSNVQALGGTLLYFQQVHQGLSVQGRGIGVVMDGQKRIKAISGPYAEGLSVSTSPALSGAAAVAAAQNNLAPFKKQWSPAVAAVLNPAYDVIQAEIGPFATPQPELNLFPTPDGVRLAYNLFLFSRNPFGVYEYQIDANTGQVLKRTNRVLYQQDPLPYTADIYPSSPKLKNPDTGELALDDFGEPAGLLRVHLRKFNPGTNLTAVDGLMTGQHAIIRNLLASKQPFAQAAAGTFHFRQNNPPLEAQPNETDDLAEPSEHLDMANNFFFITYLLEYVDHLHRAGDSVHSRFGQGSFPDSYPNSDRPLVGMVHLPSDNGLLDASGPLDTTNADTAIHSALGMDNALSFNLTRSVTLPDGSTQQVVLNPTAYGHGYLLNDLAKDGPVVYHEGMHSISSPIAGFDTDTVEGGALNEGQADLWAYSITEDPVLGNYSANGWRRRARIRAAGGDPDLRQWIRHADSGLSYSQLGTAGGSNYEVHRDGEPFASSVWDLRQLMEMKYPQTTGTYKRPALLTGNPDVAISLGKETWERLQLGATYVMGTFRPDTIVRFRDSLIIADAALYSSDPTDPDAPGLHRALIEQVFAARELGINAAPPANGKQTISTQVSAFAASQGKLAAPSGVTATTASGTSTRVSWQAVPGAFAYHILRRQVGKEGQRQNAPVPGREYIDGDGSTDGYLGIDYVNGGQTSYVDNGNIESGFVRRGNGNALAYEYVIRALSSNANKQVGISDNSAAASVPSAALDVTGNVQTAISNVSFANGRFELDQTIKNLGAGAFDGMLYTPVEFRILSISDPTVTVANADNAGTGAPGKPASFFFRQLLATGQTSAPRHLIFNDPNARLFTLDAVVTARVQVNTSEATRYQPEPPPDLSNYEPKTFTDLYNGILPASDLGLQVASGVTYADVPFTSRDGAFAITGKLTSPTTGVDMDLILYDSAGNQLAASETEFPTETVNAPIKPNRNYFYRVVGWAGVAQDWKIESIQSALVLKAGPSSGGSSGAITPPPTGTLTQLLRFTFNPVTRTVTVSLVK
jgi:hypothetical protein